jgi:hypothetical protein
VKEGSNSDGDHKKEEENRLDFLPQHEKGWRQFSELFHSR